MPNSHTNNPSRFLTCPCCGSADLRPFSRHTSEFRPPANWKEFFYGGNHLLGPITQCGRCEFHYLEQPSPDAGKFYNAADVSDYMNAEVPRAAYFKTLMSDALKESPGMASVNMMVDMGCASGSWLNQWDTQHQRVGIELNEDFRPVLSERQIRMERSIEAVAIDEPAVISAFDFLEHVDDPLGFLESFTSLPHHTKSYYVLGMPDMGRIWAKMMGTKYYLYCPMHFNYFTPKSLEMICNRAFPEHKITIINSPIMYTNIDGLLKWILPSLNVGKLGSLPIPVGYRSNIVAIVSPNHA